MELRKAASALFCLPLRLWLVFTSDRLSNVNLESHGESAKVELKVIIDPEI